MAQKIIKWLSIRYDRIVTSIAFLPAVIALLFLLLTAAMLWLDFSSYGKEVKARLHWLSLKDASTARSIISAIVSGIISLTVFSFSMVMIVLNQAASQMSNRVLDKLIGNRFQQMVLGFYIGTIVYALALLSTIRDTASGIYVPALSTYLLILFTVFDVFLFIYFLHYITQTVKYETVIYKIFRQTRKEMEQNCPNDKAEAIVAPVPGIGVEAPRSGLFQSFQKKSLLALCSENGLTLSFLYPAGSFLLQGTPFYHISGKQVSDELKNRISMLITIQEGKRVETSYYYGFRQLMEVAIRALSPGINDPGTAVISMQVLTDLLAYRMHHHPQNALLDKQGQVRVITREKSFEDLFTSSLLPIWDYGKNDRLVQAEMYEALLQLKQQGQNHLLEGLFQSVTKALHEKQKEY